MNLNSFTKSFKFSNWKTRSKVIAGTIAPLSLILIIAGISAFGLHRTEKISGWVEHTHKVLGKADGVIAAAVDMETGMRGYLLAGKEDFLDPYKKGGKAAYERISNLQKTVSDNPKQVARLGEAADVLRTWQNDVTEPQIKLRRQIGDAESMNDMATLVGKAEGKVYFDKFRSQIATFIKREEVLLKKRQEAGNTRWVVHTFKVIQKANAIIAAAVNMETGMRGYLLAGKEEFLDPYKSGGKRFDKLTQELKETVSDNPAQVKLLDAVRTTIAAWKGKVTEKQIALRRKIGDAKTMDDMADLVGQAKGKVYFDKFRQLMADFKSEEEHLMGVRQAERASTVQNTDMSLAIGTLLAFLIGTALAWFVGNAIGKPIRSITKAMGFLADGDTSVDIVGAERKDEIGEMAAATQVFKDNAIEKAELEKSQAEADKRAAEEKQRLMSKLADEFDSSVGSIIKTVASAAEQMNNTAQTMSGIASEASGQAASAASASEEAAANVQTVAAASEEMAASVGEINQQLSSATEASRRAVETVSDTSTQIKTLAESADKIGEVVKMISEIAEQTNLLALNATIESARAGEAGKGFAVVAGEVKELAGQTARATEEIHQQIETVQGMTRQAVTAMSDISEVISQLDETSTAIASAMEEQGSTTQEIARNTQQAATGTQEVTENVAGVTHAAQEAGSTSNQVTAAASELLQQSDMLRSTVEEFIGKVRAA